MWSVLPVGALLGGFGQSGRGLVPTMTAVALGTTPAAHWVLTMPADSA